MRLFLLFLVVPLIEIALFIQIGGLIGLGWTLFSVVVTAILGTLLVRSQGLAVLRSLQGSLEDMRDPTEALVHGAMILFSGALLLTPGFFTDGVGFALLVPSVRSAVFRTIRKRVVAAEYPHGPGPRDPRDPTIIDAEFEDLGARDPQSGPSGWTRH